MAIESREELKTYFETGDIPTQEQFYDVIDSYIHQFDDGVYVYKQPGTGELFFGVGIKTPASRLGVQSTGGNDSLMAFHSKDHRPRWYFSMNPAQKELSGFSFDEAQDVGEVSRMIIKNGGNVGIGTISPTQKLHLESSSPSNVVGLKIKNLANLKNQGWIIGHAATSVSEDDGAFALFESTVDPTTARYVVRAGGNFGIGENNPDTKLQVSMDLTDVNADLDLGAGTGIVVIGPITDNIVADWRGIQARHGEYLDTVIDLTAATLNFQRVGGDILIHGDDDIDMTAKAIITADAQFGLGTVTPAERIDIDGAIKIGTTTNTNEGAIRFTGTDFEGYKSGAWVSLTAGNGPWTPATGEIHYTAGTTSRVGIGTTTAVSATLEVNDAETVTQGNTAASIYNHSQTTSSGQDDNRVVMRLRANGTWGGDPKSKNVGLYVSEVSGQDDDSSNLAAVLNGNVVVGDMVSASRLIGLSGKNVFSIQNGTAPDNVAETNSIQIYSANISGIPTMHIMRGNAELIKLYKEAGLTAADATVITDTYSSVEKNVINNLRIRLNQLETRLMNLGLLNTPV